VADNTVYQLSIGLFAKDMMSSVVQKASDATLYLTENVKALGREIGGGFKKYGEDYEKNLNGAEFALSSLNMGMDKAAGSRLPKMAQGFRVLGKSVLPFGKMLTEAQEKIEGFDLAIGGSGASTSLLEFEQATHLAAVNLGQAGDSAKYMSSEILSGVASTQYSVGEISALNSGLSAVGVNMASFGRVTQDTMIGLVNTFGMSAEQIASTNAVVGSFDGSITELADDAAKFQKDFQMPGMFRELEGVTQFALDAQLRFGKEVVGSGKDVIRGVMKMGGVFAKTFGTDIAGGLEKARAHMGALAGSSRHFKDVFLGLESGMDPLTQAFQRVGANLFQTQKLFQDTQDDPIAFAEAVQRMRKNIPSKLLDDKFMRELQKTLPESTYAMIENTNLLTEAQNQQAAAFARSQSRMGKSESAFKELNDTALDTVLAMKDMWKNVRGMIAATMRQTGLTDALKDAFKGAKDTFVGFSKGIQEFVEGEGFQAWAGRLKPLLASVGKWTLLAGSAFGGLFSAIAGFKAAKAGFGVFNTAMKTTGTNLARFGKVTGVNGVVGKGITKLTGGIGKLAGKFPLLSRTGKIAGKSIATFGKMGAKAIPGVGQVIAAVGGIGTALMDMGDVLGDPNATGMEKFEALARGTIKGTVDFFDNLLLGIPSMILNKFFPDLEDSFDRGFENLFGGVRDYDLGEALGTMWDTAWGWLKDKVGNLDKSLKGSLPSFRETAAGIGKTLGGAIGGLASMLADLVVWNFKRTFLAFPMWIYSLFTDSGEKASEGMEAAGPGMMDSFLGIINSMGLAAWDLIKGIGDGILGAFGTSLKGVGIGAQLIWNGIKEGAIDMTASIVSGIFRFTSLFGSGMDILADSGDRGWAMFKLAGLQAFSSIVDTFLGEGGMIASLMEGFEKLAVAFGQEDIAIQIAGARKSMAGFSSDLTKDAKVLSDQIADEADLTKVWAEAQTKATMAAEEGTKGILGYKDAIAESNKALHAEMDAEAKKQEQQGLAGKFARAAKKDVRDNLQQQLQGAAGFEDLNSQSAKVATKNLKQFMDATIAGLSKEVASGALDVTEATKALHKAEAKGIAQAISAAKTAQDATTGKAPASAGSVAGAARGPGGGGTLTAAQMSAFQKSVLAASQAGGGNQRVQIWLRGAGALDREIAKQSAIKALNEGN
jgi:hypothetical protein